MNIKKIFSLFLVIFGEALLIFSFLYLGRNVESEILTLNIIVSSIIYCILFIDIILPWVDFKDKSQKKIGTLGLRWFFTFLYILLAIGSMVVFNSVIPIQFTNQIIIQGILFFFLLLGFFMSFSTSDKVKAVYVEEKQNRDRIDQMKWATKELQLKLDAMNNIPSEIISRVNELQVNLNYLSPSNNNEAIVLEVEFLDNVKKLLFSFSDNPINMEVVITNIKNCERTYKERKLVFSN
jgi:hypothetical protein